MSSYFYGHSFRTRVICRNQLYNSERIRSLVVRSAERGVREERRKVMNGPYEGGRQRRGWAERKRVFLAITHCFVDCFGRHWIACSRWRLRTVDAAILCVRVTNATLIISREISIGLPNKIPSQEWNRWSSRIREDWVHIPNHTFAM